MAIVFFWNCPPYVGHVSLLTSLETYISFHPKDPKKITIASSIRNDAFDGCCTTLMQDLIHYNGCRDLNHLELLNSQGKTHQPERQISIASIDEEPIEEYYRDHHPNGWPNYQLQSFNCSTMICSLLLRATHDSRSTNDILFALLSNYQLPKNLIDYVLGEREKKTPFSGCWPDDLSHIAQEIPPHFFAFAAHPQRRILRFGLIALEILSLYKSARSWSPGDVAKFVNQIKQAHGEL